jgi:predicted transcriptional regulator YdeE
MNEPTNEPRLVARADVTLPALHVAGLSCRTHNGEAARTIPALWGRVFAAGLPARAPGIIPFAGEGSAAPLVAVYHAYESDHRGPYTLTIGVAVASAAVVVKAVPELQVVTVPAQRAAHLVAAGQRPAAVFGAWAHVWSHLTPRRTFAGDLELYWPELGEEGPVELYVGVRQGGLTPA